MQLKTVLIIILLTTISFAQTSIWKVSKGKNYLYLGGTIHLLRPSDYPLPSQFSEAYANSEQLVFETDMSKMNSPELQQKLLKAVQCEPGTTLKDILSPEVYKELTAAVTANGMPMIMFDNLKPSMVSMMLTQFEMTKFEMAEEGVDMHFYKKAAKDSKPIYGLETIEQQVQFIANLGKDDPDGLIRNTIEEIGAMEDMINTMIDVWRQGDADGLDSMMVREMKEKHPQIYKSMLVDRNINWYPEIKDMLRSKPVELILVGAGHVVGSEGLLEMLKRDGYTVTQMK